MTNRCGGYWSLMLRRDRAAHALKELRETNPNGSGRAEITQAEIALADTQELETEHLLTCPVCSRWREEMTVLAERAQVAAEEGEE